MAESETVSDSVLSGRVEVASGAGVMSDGAGGPKYTLGKATEGGAGCKIWAGVTIWRGEVNGMMLDGEMVVKGGTTSVGRGCVSCAVDRFSVPAPLSPPFPSSRRCTTAGSSSFGPGPSSISLSP